MVHSFLKAYYLLTFYCWILELGFPVHFHLKMYIQHVIKSNKLFYSDESGP